MQAMRKTLLAAAVLCAAGAAASLAQEGAARSPRIGVIDAERIWAESQLGKGYAAQIDKLQKDLEAEGAKRQTEIQKLEATIKTLQEDLQKQQGVLSQEARDRKEQEILKKRREGEALVEDAQRELQRMRERAIAQRDGLQADFQQKVRPHIDAVAREKGIDIILLSQVAMTVNKDFDISKDVIAKADAAPRAAAPAAAPAAAGPRPAAPAPAPAATPAPSPTPAPQQ
jgi:Skp family chaperone for outer membrane proteins